MLKNKDKRKLEVVKMKRLRVLFGVSIRNSISNETIRKTNSWNINHRGNNGCVGWGMYREEPRKLNNTCVKARFHKTNAAPEKVWIDKIKYDTCLPMHTAERRDANGTWWGQSSRLVRATGARGDNCLTNQWFVV